MYQFAPVTKGHGEYHVLKDEKRIVLPYCDYMECDFSIVNQRLSISVHRVPFREMLEEVFVKFLETGLSLPLSGWRNDLMIDPIEYYLAESSKPGLQKFSRDNKEFYCDILLVTGKGVPTNKYCTRLVIDYINIARDLTSWMLAADFLDISFSLIERFFYIQQLSILGDIHQEIFSKLILL